MPWRSRHSPNRRPPSCEALPTSVTVEVPLAAWAPSADRLDFCADRRTTKPRNRGLSRAEPRVRIQFPPARSRANGGHRCDGREQRSRSCERWNRSTCAPVIRAVPASAYRSSCRAAVQGAAAHRPDQAASRHGSAVGRVSASRNRTACQPLLRKTIAWYNSDVCLPPPISPWSGRSTEPQKICPPGR